VAEQRRRPRDSGWRRRELRVGATQPKASIELARERTDRHGRGAYGRGRVGPARVDRRYTVAGGAAGADALMRANVRSDCSRPGPRNPHEPHESPERAWTSMSARPSQANTHRRHGGGAARKGRVNKSGTAACRPHGLSSLERTFGGGRLF